MKKNIVLVFCLLFHIYTLTAQTNIGVRFFAPTIHPFQEENNLLYSSKIDTAGKFLIEPGVVLTFENYADNNKVAIRMEQAFYKDGTKNSSVQSLDIRPVSIGEDSHIGANSVILAGCSIGKRCQIGAGSVVTKSIPDFSIAVGNPARIIKRYSFETKDWERV